MDDAELSIQLDLAAMDDSWMVYILRKNNDSIRLYRKSHLFPHANFVTANELIAADLSKELAELARQQDEQSRTGIVQEIVGGDAGLLP